MLVKQKSLELMLTALLTDFYIAIIDVQVHMVQRRIGTELFTGPVTVSPTLQLIFFLEIV